jgi:hypothetical protein
MFDPNGQDSWEDLHVLDAITHEKNDDELLVHARCKWCGKSIVIIRGSEECCLECRTL